MPSAARRQSVTLAAVALVVVALGTLVWLAVRWIEGDTDPVTIARGDVPYSLLDESRPIEREPVDPQSRRDVLYLVFGDALVPVERVVPRDAAPIDLVEQLVRGPDREEIARGLTTHVTPDAAPGEVTIRGNRAVLELQGALQDGPSSDGRTLAIAQLVYTMTALPGVDRVVFELDGARAEVPAGDGTLVRTPLERADFPMQVLASPP